jgi:hypothetical protein
MPAPRNEASTRAVQAPRPDGRAASARTAARQAGNGAAEGVPRPEETETGKRRRRWAERGISEPPGAALHGLLRGLREGDLESVLLTVAMAADENRMPCADPDEERRILRFLARLAEHDAALPPPPGGAGVRPEWPLDRTGDADGAPAR